MADWQAKMHELVFSEAERVKLKAGVEKLKTPVLRCFENLAVNNNSIKVKSTEFYSSWTFSYTLDKSHPKLGGHTYWFYDTNIERGIRVMDFYVRELLNESEQAEEKANQKALW